MPKRRDKLPKYGLHTRTGQARVVLDGRCFYLGKFGTEKSWQEYERIVQEWESERHVYRAEAAGRTHRTIRLFGGECEAARCWYTPWLV